MKRISLKSFFILFVVITVFFLNLIIVSFFAYYNYKQQKKSLEYKIYEITKSLYPVIENYLWEIDLKNLKKLANILVQSNNVICNIIIFDDENNIVGVEYKRSIACSKEYLHPVSKKIYHNNQIIGYVKLSYTSFFVKKFTLNYILSTTAFTFTLSILVILIISITFKKFVNQPIENIVKIFSEIEKGNYNVKLTSSRFIEYNYILKNLERMINEIKGKEIRFNTIINSIPACIFIFDEKGRYIDVSQGCCELLKMTKDEILKSNIGDISAEGFTTSKGFEILQNALINDSYIFEWKFKTKDNKTVDVLGTSKKIKLNDTDAILFALTDITYVRKLEKEIIKKEKLEVLSVIAGGIAHDFNNILTTIEGNIELLNLFIEKGKIDSVKKKLNILSKSIDRAKFLTNQLLTFSKGSLSTKPELISPEKVIKEVSEFLLSGSEVEVIYDFDKNLKKIMIDPDQFGIVIQNILINSLQAMNYKGKIIIKAINSLDNLEISIKDYGPGIPKENLERIWEPFFTTKSNGSGLGLSIVKSIIEQNNGSIKVYSKKGKFTEIKIILPAYDDEVENNEKESLNIEKDNFSDLNMLVLEDEKEVQTTLKEMLELLGINSEFANSGEEAIEKFKKKKFDIVLLDLTIKGGMDGKECIRHLKKIDPDVCAIVYSGYFDDPVIKDFKKYGFKYSLKKPFKLIELKKAIKSCTK